MLILFLHFIIYNNLLFTESSMFCIGPHEAGNFRPGNSNSNLHEIS